MATLENAQYEKDLVGVGVQLGVAGVIIVTCVHLFEVLRKRPRFQHLFTPRCRLVKNPTPPIPPGLYAWLPHVWRLDEEFYYTHVGLDAVMHLRFLRMAAQLFGIVGLLIFAVLMPINYLTHTMENAREVSQFSISNIPPQSHYFWAHLVFMYVLCFALMYLLLRNSLDYAKMLSDSMLLKVTSGSIVPRSVLVSHIPRELRNDATLKHFFESLGLGPVDSATMIRNYSKLNRRINQRKAVLQSLEQSHLDLARAFVALARRNQSFLMEVPVHDDPKAVMHNQACEDMLHYLQLIRKGRKGRKDLTALFEKDPMFFWRALSNLHRPLLDSSQPKLRVKNISESDWDPTIDTLLYKLAKVERRVRQLRQPTKVAENFKPTRYGVVTFRHYNAAQACIRLTVSGQLHHLSTTTCPEPRDLMWSHFLFDERQKLVRFLVVNGCVWTLIIVWLIPMVPFVGLASLDNLIKLFPFLEPLSVNTPWVKNFIERNVPSMLTSALMVILPFIVFAISRLQFFPSHSALEETVIQRNFYFSIFNVLIFFCAGPPLIKSIEAWWKNPISLLDTLASSLTGQGEAFFINYVIFTSCSHALELSQIGIPLISTIFADNRWLLSTPRKAQRYRSPWSFPYFYYLPTHMLIFVISLTFVVTTPLMIPFSLYYFFSAYIVYKHQFAYAYVKQYEANGRYWIHMLNFSMFGMCFTVIMFILVMSLKKAVAAAIATAPLLLMCLAFAMYMRRNLFPRMKTVPLQRTAVTHLPAEQNQEEPGTVGYARTFPRMTSPLARASRDQGGGQIGTDRPGDSGSGSHSESSSSSCDRPSGALSSMSESYIFPERDTDTMDTLTTMGTQTRPPALPAWYRPWMRYLGLQALCYHWHGFCKSLVTSTIDYKPKDLEAVQMYRGTQPVLERVITSTSTPDGGRGGAATRRRGNTLTLGSSGGEDRLGVPTVHGKVANEDLLAPPGSTVLTNPLRGTCRNSPHLRPAMRVSRALSFHSICGSEVSHNEGPVSNLKLCQDLSTPLESYLHPRLIKALSRRLWVPANPLQRLYHDLEAECIELDAALVTAALLATNPKAGQLRSTYKIAEQYEWLSSSKKSLLNHIPYFYKINRTAKDLTAGTQKLLTEITTDLTGELKKKTSPVPGDRSPPADGGRIPRSRSSEVPRSNRRSGLGSRNEVGASFLGILRSSFARTRSSEDPQPTSQASHSLSNSTLSASEKEEESNLSMTLRSHPSRSLLDGHASMRQGEDYLHTTPVKVTSNNNSNTPNRESEPTSDTTLTRSVGDATVELGFRAFNHSPPPVLSVTDGNSNVHDCPSSGPAHPLTVAPPVSAATRRHSFSLLDFSPTVVSTALPDQSVYPSTVHQDRSLRRLSWRPRVHFTGVSQRDVGVEAWPLLQTRRKGGNTTPESYPSPPSIAGGAKDGGGGNTLELLPVYGLGRSVTMPFPAAMDHHPNSLHESCAITVYDSPPAGSSTAAATSSPSAQYISRRLTAQSMQGDRCVVPAAMTSGAVYTLGNGSDQVAIDGLNTRSPAHLPQNRGRHSLAASDELLGMLSDGLSHDDSDSDGSGSDAEGDATEMRGLYEEDW
ncbi:hypothetical protein IWQ62_000132 [Dispira parvispora]|uniref:Uncharacterized protein n=1 Tax=Dispira parvispora TaxID=1520584 RepID=A0A9W8AWL7_9FUNG|nr:hypothetical protein IWQ62_000132 [Dispira parvispora]